MIRKTSEMPSLLLRIIADVETEVVEYKAAKQNYDFEDIGKYFSALSNEQICARQSADGFSLAFQTTAK